MEKEPCTKFCGVLISSREVMKLQSFESGVSDVITANTQNISPLFNFMKRKLLHSSMVVLTISHELVKL